MAYEDKSEVLEDVRIVYRNFAGEEGQYNRAGDRNFSVVLNDDTAKNLIKAGYNVKTKPPREEGEEEFHTLKVKVSFKGRPPRLVMISSRGRTTLGEEECELLDWAEITNVDLIIQPYEWTVSGKKGIAAYLKSIYVQINEDYLEKKYADVREIDSRSGPLVLPKDFDPNVIDTENVEDS